MDEIQKVQERFVRRQLLSKSSLYNPLNPSVYMGLQEKERILIKWINFAGLDPVKNKLLEIGCGSGGNILELLKLGFKPENLVGNELLEERVTLARYQLPRAVKILSGDASTLDLERESFDVVFQSTVFTSLLDDEFQHKMANRMWSLVKPGGGILWYDFIYNNPKNPDVKGIPVAKIKALFPYGKIKIWHLTLAPPISRVVTKVHPWFYNLFNAFPFLRTHVLCWIKKF